MFKASKIWILLAPLFLFCSHAHTHTHINIFWKALQEILPSVLGIAAQPIAARGSLPRPRPEKNCSGNWVISFPDIVWVNGTSLTPSPLWHSPAPQEQPGVYLKASHLLHYAQESFQQLERRGEFFLFSNVFHHFNRRENRLPLLFKLSYNWHSIVLLAGTQHNDSICVYITLPQWVQLTFVTIHSYKKTFFLVMRTFKLSDMQYSTNYSSYAVPYIPMSYSITRSLDLLTPFTH